MNQPSGPSLRYGAVAQAFHWATALLVLAAYLVSPGGSEERAYRATADFDRALHEDLGMLVFALVLLRLIWRLCQGVPEAPPMPRWMEASARLAHYALYGLLVAIPVTAILGAWWQGHALSLLGLGELPAALATDKALGDAMADIHGWLGNIILWVAGGHAAAALYHHFFLRDRVLVSMLPWQG